MIRDRFYVTAATDKSPIEYKCGEDMVFTVWAAKNFEGKAVYDKIKYRRIGDDDVVEEGEWDYSGGEPLVFKTKIMTPGFVFIHAWVEGENAEGVEHFWGGAGAEIEKLYPITEEPSVYGRFWSDTLADVEKCSLTPIEAKDARDDVRPGFRIYDMKIPSPYGRPVSGFLAIPDGAEVGSLPIRLRLAGYGIHSAQKHINGSEIVFDMNANGIENLREPEYYSALAQGELKEYGLHERGDNPYESYFRTIIGRGLQALRYLRSLPEWNGRDITVCGTSQGGMQALNIAALDKTVTRCEVNKPWFCDRAAETVGRRRPDFCTDITTDSFACFDCAVQARHIDCPVRVTAGIGDYVCPPSSVMAMFIALKTDKKEIEWIQGETHSSSLPIPVRYKFRG